MSAYAPTKLKFLTVCGIFSALSTLYKNKTTSRVVFSLLNAYADIHDHTRIECEKYAASTVLL